jgi:hypothetical protein
MKFVTALLFAAVFVVSARDVHHRSYHEEPEIGTVSRKTDEYQVFLWPLKLTAIVFLYNTEASRSQNGQGASWPSYEKVGRID